MNRKDQAPAGGAVEGGTALTKQYAQLAANRIGYLDEGKGPPVVLLHGCPFSSFVWRGTSSPNSARGSGAWRRTCSDSATPKPGPARTGAPAQTAAVVDLLDHLGLDRAAVVGHDQGGAIAQLLVTNHPDRVTALVLANAEAYDNWPSAEELPFVRATQLPIVGRLVLWAWSRRPLFRWALASGKAVHDRSALSDELIDGYIAANLATAHRRAKTRRFLAAQLDPANQAHTTDAVPALALRQAHPDHLGQTRRALPTQVGRAAARRHPRLAGVGDPL